MATNWNAILSNTNNLNDVLSILRKVLAELNVKADFTTIDGALETINNLDTSVQDKLGTLTDEINNFNQEKTDALDDLNAAKEEVLTQVNNITTVNFISDLNDIEKWHGRTVYVKDVANFKYDAFDNEWAVASNVAESLFDKSGLNQQQINNILLDPLTKEGILGDGQFRIVTDLWAIGSTSYRFESRTVAEAYLGFNISTELIDVGLNTSVDTAYLQKYIIAASAKFLSTGVPTTIKLKSDATYIITGLQMYPGVNIISEGQTEFKKRPALDITNEAVTKWWRIMAVKANAFTTTSATKHRCVIDGVKFNGNMLNMNWTYNTYSQEQGSSLLLQGATGSSGGSANTRAKFLVRNLDFIDSVSDGLHIVQNCDVILDGRLSARDCFRGGLVMTGGNTIVVGGGMISNNARFDIEVDSAGYDGSMYSYRNIKDYYQDIGGKLGDFIGGADIDAKYGGETFLGNFYVYSQPTNITSATSATDKGKSLLIENGVLTWGAGDSTANRIINPLSGKIFKNVKHRLETGGYVYVFTSFGGYLTVDDWVFDGGSFEYVGSAGGISDKLIEIASQSSDSPGFMVLKDVDTTKAPSLYLVSHPIGGKTEFSNVKHASHGAFITKGTNVSYPSVVKFRKFNESSPPLEFVKVTYNPSAFDGVIFTDTAITPSSLNIQTNNNLGGATKSNRTIYGNYPPENTTPSVVGDTYIINEKIVGKPYEWVSTTTSVANSSWRAKSWLFGSFTTADMPALTAFDAGCQNFDTTLNKIVTWVGSAWI